MRYAALLRAVNLVKRNRIAMAELRRVLADLGYEDVKTHLQSGNAVFTSDLPAAAIERDIAAALAEHCGLSCAVMVRTGAELAAILAANPLGHEPEKPSWFFVSFLAAEPDPAAVAALAALDVGPDRAWILGREAYLWCPNGPLEGKLGGPLVEKLLGVSGTARNWNTVGRLAELTAG
jgi:uncharacterized protein (DUF1697 family)